MISPAFISKWYVDHYYCDLFSCLELSAARWANLVLILGSNTVVLCDRDQVVPWVLYCSTLLETLTYNHI